MRPLWLAIAVLIAPALAVADDLPPVAQEHVDAAAVAFEAHDYAKAGTEFEAAYKLAPVPFLLFSWAQAERLAGHCPKALDLYKKYLYADISRAQIEVTRSNIKLCEAQSWMPPATPPPPPPPQPWYMNVLGDSLTGAGVIGFGVGLTYLTLGSRSETRAKQAMYLDEFQAGLDEATSRRRIGGVSLVLGAALVAGGVVVYVVHGRHVTATTDGQSVVVGGRF